MATTFGPTFRQSPTSVTAAYAATPKSTMALSTIARTRPQHAGERPSRPGQWMDRAPDISQTAPLADNPLVHKALAGLTMVVLAFSGSAVPTVIHRPEQPAQVASPGPAADSTAVDGVVAAAAAAAVPITDNRPATPAHAGAGTGAAPAAPAATAPVQPADDPAAYRDLRGGNHSKLLFGGGDDSSPNRPGGTRGSIIHRPDGSSGGLLDGTPVGKALESALSAVSQAVPLPVDVGLSVPGVTGPLTAPLSAMAQLPAGQSMAVQVPPALTGVLAGVLQPVTAVLLGDTPAPPGLSGLSAGH